MNNRWYNWGGGGGGAGVVGVQILNLSQATFIQQNSTFLCHSISVVLLKPAESDLR